MTKAYLTPPKAIRLANGARLTNGQIIIGGDMKQNQIQRPLNSNMHRDQIGRDGCVEKKIADAPIKPGMTRQTSGDLHPYLHGQAVQDEPNALTRTNRSKQSVLNKLWRTIRDEAMTTTNPQIDPAQVFQQAECFYQALAVLRALHSENDRHLRNLDTHENLHAAITLVEPVIVLSAFTTELFLKCLIRIEAASATPRTHDLKELFGQLSTATRTRLQNLWDSDVAMRRSKRWNELEKFGLKMPRDLPSALAKGSNAFDRIRYSYEGNTENLHYYLEDLPTLLERVILEMKPEFEAWRRMPLPRRPSGTNRF